jgi:hypothetical protein
LYHTPSVCSYRDISCSQILKSTYSIIQQNFDFQNIFLSCGPIEDQTGFISEGNFLTSFSHNTQPHTFSL